MKTGILFTSLLCIIAFCLVVHLSMRADAPFPEPTAAVEDEEEDGPALTETKVFEEIPAFSNRRRGKFYFNQEDSSIISVWRENAPTSIMAPVWRHELDCDPECPHTFFWADFDGDGSRDLFLLSGDEFNGATEVLLQRGEGENLKFLSALRDDEDLGSVVYLDGEKRPVVLLRAGELVDDEGEVVPSDVCVTDAAARAVQTEVDRKYTQLSREFASLNYDYGVTSPDISLDDWKAMEMNREAAFEGLAGPSLHNLKIFEPYRVLTARGDRFVDTTFRHPQFTRWRLGMLRRARAVASPTCRDYIDSLLDESESEVARTSRR